MAVRKHAQSNQSAAEQTLELHAKLVDIIVQYAIAGFPKTDITWQEACAASMKANNITTEEVEVEVEMRRQKHNQ